LASWFPAEVTVKGYQAYKDSWATVLEKKYPARATRSLKISWREGSAAHRETWHAKAPG